MTRPLRRWSGDSESDSESAQGLGVMRPRPLAGPPPPSQAGPGAQAVGHGKPLASGPDSGAARLTPSRRKCQPQSESPGPASGTLSDIDNSAKNTELDPSHGESSLPVSLFLSGRAAIARPSRLRAAAAEQPDDFPNRKC